MIKDFVQITPAEYEAVMTHADIETNLESTAIDTEDAPLGHNENNLNVTQVTQSLFPVGCFFSLFKLKLPEIDSLHQGAELTERYDDHTINNVSV